MLPLNLKQDGSEVSLATLLDTDTGRFLKLIYKIPPSPNMAPGLSSLPKPLTLGVYSVSCRGVIVAIAADFQLSNRVVSVRLYLFSFIFGLTKKMQLSAAGANPND